MNILIAGGSGFIGASLTRSLLASGHSVSILTRRPAQARLPQGAKALGWDGQTTDGWLGNFSEMDAVVNLAGETVGRWPWNAERKTGLRSSRIRAGQAISSAYAQSTTRPPVLIQASGVGYYGPRDAAPLDESAPAGSDFMAGLAAEWEDSTAQVAAIPGVRRAVIRTALVLDASQGVLPLMAMPVRLFAGGRLGNGRQGVSWIHIDDQVAAIRFLIDTRAASGVFNLSAPGALSNAEFLRSLAGALGRPYWLPAPGFALRLLLGEMSTLLLDGQYVLPRALTALGFHFRYESADEALRAIYRR